MRWQVLVADDELGMRDMYAYALEPLGCDVVATSDGASALAALEARRFDLLILDVHMPGISGLEVLARVKRRWPEQPVLVISGSADPVGSIEAEATASGAARCLFKPVDLGQLAAAIQAVLGGNDG